MTDSTGWLLREERPIYTGATHKYAAEKGRAGMAEALNQGYLAESVAWSVDGLEVTIEYVYDPARVGRPL